MTNLNVEALLAKNPQVDQEKLRRTEQKVREVRKAVGQKSKDVVRSPFGGRRLRSDDKSKEESGFSIENRRRS